MIMMRTIVPIDLQLKFFNNKIKKDCQENDYRIFKFNKFLMIIIYKDDQELIHRFVQDTDNNYSNYDPNLVPKEVRIENVFLYDLLKYFSQEEVAKFFKISQATISKNLTLRKKKSGTPIV